MDDRISFTPEQQIKVDALIHDAYKRAYAKAAVSKSPSTDGAELERLKAEKDLEIERLRAENTVLRNQGAALKNKNIFSSFWR